MESEILSDEELAEITKQRSGQRRWLKEHHWHFVENRGGRPLPGRQYAHMKLGMVQIASGLQPPPLPASTWPTDLSWMNGDATAQQGKPQAAAEPVCPPRRHREARQIAEVLGLLPLPGRSSSLNVDRRK